MRRARVSAFDWWVRYATYVRVWHLRKWFSSGKRFGCNYIQHTRHA